MRMEGVWQEEMMGCQTAVVRAGFAAEVVQEGEVQAAKVAGQVTGLLDRHYESHRRMRLTASGYC